MSGQEMALADRIEAVSRLGGYIIESRDAALIVAALRRPATTEPVRAALDKLADKIAAKIAQLEHYRDNDCQLDHARTIAEGRLIQANQMLHWIADAALSSGEPDTNLQKMQIAPEGVRRVLAPFYKAVDVMKAACNNKSKVMHVWADDMKSVEDVMFFLENLRDSLTASAPARACTDSRAERGGAA